MTNSLDLLQVVVGGQYGSEGKGAIAAHLTHPDRFGHGLAIRVAGPNAGHSVIAPDGRKWALRQVPVAAVVNPHATLGIAAGSEIDPEVLTNEVIELDQAGYNVRSRLLIDESATIIEPGHRAKETGLVGQIGSTGKGIGAARAARIMRQASLVRDFPTSALYGRAVSSLATVVRRTLGGNHRVLVEGTQGYGLGLHTTHYPQVTSSDCRAIDFLAMAGISPWHARVWPEVYVVMRPYPIRVAGNSGPMFRETSWESLGLPSEQTTVTHKTRRVGLWDPDLAIGAIRANGGPAVSVKVALTMADHIDPSLAGVTDPDVVTKSEPLARFRDQIQLDLLGSQIRLIGTGPGTVADVG